MQVFVRNVETAEYFGGDSWVVAPDRARNFVTTEAAVRFCREHELNGLEVVLRYDNPVNEITFPIDQ